MTKPERSAPAASKALKICPGAGLKDVLWECLAHAAKIADFQLNGDDDENNLTV
ncbi:MAG: hypothetical protein WC619_02565 [Patescibacteria group bacterium]